MLIDIHVHEQNYSFDSFIGLYEIIDHAKQLGLGAVCITDHDSNGLKDMAYHVSKEKNFLVIVGAEILTHEGDVLVFGIEQLPQEKMHADDLATMVKSKGGVAIGAHPYRQNGRGMGDQIKKIDGLSGIEGLNGSTPFHLNEKACRMALQLNIPVLGGSDAHHIPQLGKYATIFPEGIRDEKDFIEAILEGKLEPALLHENSYHSFTVDEVKAPKLYL